MIIAFEGVDGSGKSTIMKAIAEKLSNKYPNLKVNIMHEPGGTPVSEKIREVLLNNEMDELTRLILFEASRAELFKSTIVPNIDDIWLFDRFTLSTNVYQGLKVNRNLIDEFNNLATQGIYADFTAIIDINKETMMERRGNEMNVLDSFCAQNFETLRNDFVNPNSGARIFYDNITDSFGQDKTIDVKVYNNDTGTDIDKLVEIIYNDIVERIGLERS